MGQVLDSCEQLVYQACSWPTPSVQHVDLSLRDFLLLNARLSN